eukprot:9878343-Ditylum_brightwellii.AAC.1
MAVVMNLNNGSSSGQSETSSGQSGTSVRKPGGVNTILAVASNIEHGVMIKTSNTPTPPGASHTEMMALPEQ